MFKKLTIAALIALFVTAAIPALANTQVDIYEDQKLVKSVVFVAGRSEYFVNGETPGHKMDVAPYIENGRTFVPVRYLGYALGVTEDNVKWDGNQQRASLTLPLNTVEMMIGKAQIIKNGQAKDIDVAPQLKPPGRTFLPARYVAEGLGFNVHWDPSSPDLVVCYIGDYPTADVTKVKEFIIPDPIGPIGTRFPANAVRVYSTAELGVKPAWVHSYNDTAVYKATVKVSDLPVPLDGIMIYGLEIDRENWNKYDTYAITITASDKIYDLRILPKDGEQRNRQIYTSQQMSDGKWVLNFAPQHTAEKVNGIPLLHLEDVEYFVVDTTGKYPPDDAGLLFIENPYKS